jgi:hypothetical protein
MLRAVAWSQLVPGTACTACTACTTCTGFTLYHLYQLTGAPPDSTTLANICAGGGRVRAEPHAPGRQCRPLLQPVSGQPLAAAQPGVLLQHQPCMGRHLPPAGGGGQGARRSAAPAGGALAGRSARCRWHLSVVLVAGWWGYWCSRVGHGQATSSDAVCGAHPVGHTQWGTHNGKEAGVGTALMCGPT